MVLDFIIILILRYFFKDSLYIYLFNYFYISGGLYSFSVNTTKKQTFDHSTHMWVITPV